MKTLPLILLTLTAYGHAAPATVNPSSDATTGDIEIAPPSPTLDYEVPDVPATVTPFFTPAVFLPNYWTRPTSMPAYVDSDDASLVAAPEPAAIPESTVTSSTVDGPTETSVGVPVPEPTLFDGAEPSTLPTPDAADTISVMKPGTSTYNEDATLVMSMSSTSITFSMPTSEVTFVPIGTSSHRAISTSSHAAIPLPSDGAKSESQTTLMSRKAAIIGTMLAVGSLLGIGACAFCTRCRTPRLVRRSSMGDVVDEHESQDPEKALLQKSPTQTTSPSQQHGTTLVLPTLAVDAPPSVQRLAPDHDITQRADQQHSNWQNQANMEPNDFEDVTHILSEGIFASLPESELSSTVSDDTDDASVAHRASKGTVSVKAESYATFESRYSHTSVKSEDQGSTQYLSMSPSSTPSPPESPVLRTPKQPGICAVTRTRSKTLTQPSSPRVGSTVSSSKSFPAKYSGRMSDLVDRMEDARESTLESEWDIAAAYGARYSKASSAGARGSVHGAEVAERIETVDIGGRNCVLVTGYAF